MRADSGPAVHPATAAQGIEPRRQVLIDAQAEEAEHPLHMPRCGVYIAVRPSVSTMTDPRITNQKTYLLGVALAKKAWVRPAPDWDHDHCAFCWAKFAEPPVPM